MSDDPSARTVEQARAGDRDAFGALFETHQADVRRLCERLLGRGGGAEDAASEAFLRASAALDGYDPRQPFRRWLLSIAAHRCIDLLRRRRTEARLFDPTEMDEAALPAPGPSPLAGLLQAEARRELLAVIEELPERYRAPLVLRHFAELDYDAIGELLGVSRGQVGTLLFRARRRVRERLAPSESGGTR